MTFRVWPRIVPGLANWCQVNDIRSTNSTKNRKIQAGHDRKGNRKERAGGTKPRNQLDPTQPPMDVTPYSTRNGVHAMQNVLFVSLTETLQHQLIISLFVSYDNKNNTVDYSPYGNPHKQQLLMFSRTSMNASCSSIKLCETLYGGLHICFLDPSFPDATKCGKGITHTKIIAYNFQRKLYFTISISNKNDPLETFQSRTKEALAPHLRIEVGCVNTLIMSCWGNG